MRNVLLYGKVFTTSYVFVHVLRRLLDQDDGRLAGFHFHMVFDDRRDAAYAAGLLPASRVTAHAQYAGLDPFRSDLAWPAETIDRWERQYGIPNLRAYIDRERILEHRGPDAKWRYLLAHVEYFENLCREMRPVLWVSGPASSVHPWIGLEILRRNGVPCLSFYPTRFGHTTFALDSPYELLGVRDAYKAKLARGLTPEEDKAARAILEEYRVNAMKPVDFLWVKARGMRAVPRPARTMRVIATALFTDYRYFDEPLRIHLTRAARARRTPLYDWWFRHRTARQVDTTRRFFFFPLQFEPEMALITQGKGWVDQLEVARLISSSLPVDRWLYVKEHPNMPAGVRPLRFYHELTALPRVVLLDRRIASDAIVPHAEAVLTITSTAGWEALMLNRPVGLFGHAFYQELDEGVVRLERPEELPRILREFRSWTVPDEALLAYISAVLDVTYDGMLMEPRYFPNAAEVVMAPENLDAIGRLIVQRLVGA